jgi:hypothetical protein
MINQNDKNEFLLPIDQWADLNTERYHQNEHDWRVIGFEFEGIFITNPFTDASSVDSVDPLKAYGDQYEGWLAVYKKAVIRSSHVKNTNS